MEVFLDVFPPGNSRLGFLCRFAKLPNVFFRMVYNRVPLNDYSKEIHCIVLVVLKITVATEEERATND